MGMGYSANCCDVVRAEFIKKIVPTEWNTLDTLLKEKNMTWDELASVLNILFEDLDTDIQEAYDNLVHRFEDTTNLSLALLYHNSNDSGDRYDEVDGHFWGVDGTRQFSEAGLKYSGEIERKYWVTYG